MPNRARVATVLFTDIVGSTSIAAELGDDRWRTLVERHHAVVRRNLKRTGGREIDTAGDGFFAEFERPAQAMRCALESARGVQELGIDLRAGLHTGEVQTIAGKAGGIAVAVGARVASLGGPAEVLITSTTRDLSIGADLEVTDRGEYELKGVPGAWRVYEVRRAGVTAPEPLAPEVAAERRGAIEPTRAPRARRPLLIGLALALVLLAVIPFALLSSEEEAPPPDEPVATGGAPLRSVAAFDPETHELRHVVAVALVTSRGSWPRLITHGEGFVWVSDRGHAFRIDPEDDEPEELFTRGQLLSGVSASFRALWVSAYSDEIERYNTSTAEELPGVAITAPGEPVIAVASMIAGERAVWVSLANGALFRVDPQTLEVTELGTVGGAAAAMAIGRGSVWIVDDQLHLLHEVDAASGDLQRSIPTPNDADDVAFAGGAVWLLDTRGGTLARVDTETGEPDAAFAVGEDPADVTSGFDDVWVADQGGNAVLRIDAVSGEEIDAIDVGNAVAGVTVDPATGLVWALVAEPLIAD